VVKIYFGHLAELRRSTLMLRGLLPCPISTNHLFPFLLYYLLHTTNTLRMCKVSYKGNAGALAAVYSRAGLDSINAIIPPPPHLPEWFWLAVLFLTICQSVVVGGGGSGSTLKKNVTPAEGVFDALLHYYQCPSHFHIYHPCLPSSLPFLPSSASSAPPYSSFASRIPCSSFLDLPSVGSPPDIPSRFGDT